MAEIKISQLPLLDSATISLADQIIVNDVSAVVTKRATLYTIRSLANNNINDSAGGSKVTGNLTVTGNITFGGSIIDSEGTELTNFSQLITASELETRLGQILALDSAGNVIGLSCIRDSSPTLTGATCGIKILGETTIDSDLYVRGYYRGDGRYLTNIVTDSADHARYAITARAATFADSATYADSAARSTYTIQAERTRKISTVADATNTNRYLTFVGVTPGDDSVYTHSGLVYNPSNQNLGSSTTVHVGDGSLLTGVTAAVISADTINAVAGTANANHHVMFRNNATGQDSTHTDTQFLYNPVANRISGGDSETNLFLFGGSQWSDKLRTTAASGATNYLILKGEQTAIDSAKTDTALTFNAINETLFATRFSGDGSALTSVGADSATIAQTVTVSTSTSNSAHYLHFGSTSAGADGVDANSGIRINPSTKKLDLVADTAKITLGADSDFHLYHNGSNAHLKVTTGGLYVTNNSVGDDDGEFWFDMSTGDFHADGTVVQSSTSISSDPSLKMNITPIDNAINKISQLNGVTWNWRKNGRPGTGVVSTDVKKVLPTAVTRYKKPDGSETTEYVDYNAIIGLLIESIKDLKAEIEQLKK